MDELAERGKVTKAKLEKTQQTIADWQSHIARLQQDEIIALRSNEELQNKIRVFEENLKKTEAFDTEKATLLASKQEELKRVLPLEGDKWPLTDLTSFAQKEAHITDEIKALQTKISEQTKARNALASMTSSMKDSTIAGYYVEAWKCIAEVIGPKGLQGELIKDVLAPLTAAIQKKLTLMGIERRFYFQTEDSRGKEIFQFGWYNNSGEQRNFDALSTGEQMLLLIALMITIIERINPPLKVLVIDNAENLDSGNIKRVLNGLDKAGENLDNIIFIGVMNVESSEIPGWHIWNLDERKESVNGDELQHAQPKSA